MRLCARLAFMGLFAVALAAAPAHAERLIVSVSNHRVTVTPNYSGGELVLFGSVEKDARTPPNRGSYDLVVTVSGPRADMVTRRKERRFGIWINTDLGSSCRCPAIWRCSPIARLTRLRLRTCSGASSSGSTTCS